MSKHPVSIVELPVRDVTVFEKNTSPMVDKSEIQSTASSEISDSLRDLILGRTRRKPVKPSTQSKLEDILVTYEVIPSKDSDFEIVEKDDIKSEGNKQASVELSFHTAEGSKKSLHKESSIIRLTSATGKKRSDFVPSNSVSERKLSGFVLVPNDYNQSPSSMKTDDLPRYTTIETQTVGIQTAQVSTDPDWDCKCSYEEHECGCPECQPQKCLFGYSKKIVQPVQPIDDTTDPSNFENYTESSSQTLDIKRRQRNHCTCCNCRCWKEYESSATEQFSDSDDSYSTDFFDLPYQNNEEYLKLLRELEKKLIARNRERVRRTMMEFEKKSRQNQNLDKPVCDYDDTASLLRKLGPQQHKERKKHKDPVCCKCGRNKRVNSDILQNEKHWDELNYMESVMQEADNPPMPKRVERSLHKSSWQLDPRSGEWVKVSCFQQTDFSRPPHGDHFKIEPKNGPPPPGTMCKKECCCRQKKRR